MINNQKVGCGVITYNRPALLEKLYASLPLHVIDSIFIINDGSWQPEFEKYDASMFKQNESNLGVGKSKNRALKYLLEDGCDHCFIIEDDIFIKDETVFERYVLTSMITGVQHLNFSQHGLMNKSSDGQPNPINIINYGDSIRLPLFRHCVGAFSYYSRLCLETSGLMDEAFHNAFEHVEHTFNISSRNMHPPFWYFADIEDSHLFLGDEPWSLQQSTISSNPKQKENALNALSYFKLKYGHALSEIPIASSQELIASLELIRSVYGLKI